MQLFEYLVAFLATLGLLVTVHELGHYVIARWSGVRILCFSIGFGRPLWRRVDRRGTEWTVSMLPLGGYIRMLDERDGDFADVSKANDRSFGELHPAWRIAISLGGPFANFLLALLVYWGLAVAGTTTVMPVIGAAPQGSALERAGVPANVAVAAIDGRPIDAWDDVLQALATRLGETGVIRIETRIPGDTQTQTHDVSITDWHRGVAEPDMLGSLGMVPSRPAIVGLVEEGAPAQRGGVELWDQVVSINGTPVADWMALQKGIAASTTPELALMVRRDGIELELYVAPERRDTPEGARPVIGIGPPINQVRFGPIAAVGEAIARTDDAIGMTLSLLKKMIFGQISLSNLSGPLTIAQVAGDSARVGWHYFAGILALLSVSLGVLNLLPIPVLDGGHVIYAGAEWVTGKPVPEKVQIVGFQFGMFVVGGLMVLALFNDFMRIFGG
ncbi:MAG: RIP metalloprotease RseP [Gammaproteobacteria bacterium]|nr:RIP metalloprotease RseP [Gammaproteobacteria bacterium]